MFQLFKRLFSIEPPAGRKRHPLVIVTAVLQIAFGALNVCGPIMHFAGLQQMMMRVQSSLQAQVPRPPGQPDFGPDKVDALMHKYAPWMDTYTNAVNGVSLLLCLTMILAGFGLLRNERWAWWVTVAYALASIGFAIFQSVFAFNYMGPMMTGMMNELFDQMPAPRPGQPDPRPMLNAFFSWMGVITGIAALLAIIYPALILSFMLVPSVQRSFVVLNAVAANGPSEPDIPTLPVAGPPDT
jgi:hypothetical protein